MSPNCLVFQDVRDQFGYRFSALRVLNDLVHPKPLFEISSPVFSFFGNYEIFSKIDCLVDWAQQDTCFPEIVFQARACHIQ
jgi:hypothetical protein